jgi:hypothetical protein
MGRRVDRQKNCHLFLGFKPLIFESFCRLAVGNPPGQRDLRQNPPCLAGMGRRVP